MKRIVRTYTHELDAAPERVFPLLCPVREYDWLPYWNCQVVHSESGVAELDCVFLTALPGDPEAVWICSRYEPNEAIDYVVFTPGRQVHHLSVRLSQPAPGKTRLAWTRAYVALTAEAETALEAFVDSRLEQINKTIVACLPHYLATGAMYRPAVHG